MLVAVVLGAAIAFPLGALARHQFSDVPDSNPYHADIDALADTGVTTGCGGGKFCPTAFVTREQMAAFMNRLGALQAGKTPVVNADRVDSRNASDLTRFAYASEDATTLLPANWQSVVYGDVTITAPTSGFVLITASATIFNSGCTATCDAFGRIVMSRRTGMANGPMTPSPPAMGRCRGPSCFRSLLAPTRSRPA